MAALPAVANVIKFTVEGSCDGVPTANSLHWAYAGTLPSAAALNAFTSALLTAWGTQFSPLMGTDCSVLLATAIDLSSTSGASGQTSNTTAGVRTGGRVPSSSAVVVSKSIARRYRGGHPRSYIQAGTFTDLDDSAHWSTGLTVAVDGAYDAVRVAVTGQVSGGCTLGNEVTVSYFTALAPRAVPLVEPVTGHTTRTHIGTQRRRLGR